MYSVPGFKNGYLVQRVSIYDFHIGSLEKCDFMYTIKGRWGSFILRVYVI